MPTVLLDTSGLYASLDRKDPNYRQARRYLEESTSPTFVVTDAIFSEAMTLIKIRLGIAFATRAGNAIRAGGPFRVHQLTAEEHDEAWGTFTRYVDKDWSYADCSVLAIAHGLRVAQVFSFDHHFDQMQSLGVTRVP
jgi:predicted nucleic acid-binding protein